MLKYSSAHCVRNNRIAVLWSVASIALSVGYTNTVFAQTAPPEDIAVTEEIVITGSRIRQNPLNAASPVNVISEEDVARTGLTSLGEILQRLPLAGSALNTKFNSSGNFGFSPDGGGVGAGSAEIALRHLEAKRTLVLVDGQRWVSGASATGIPVQVDLNTIPTNVIERIEVLQDGASAIYGSDAIGGVVNIITRKNFDGMTVTGYAGQYLGQGDGETYNVDGTWGTSNDTTSIVIAASFAQQKRVAASDRLISSFPTPGADSCTAGGCSSGTPQGRFIFETATGEFANITLNNGIVNNGMPLPGFDPDNPGTIDFHDFTNADRFNFQSFNLVQTPNRRVNIYGQVTHQIFEEVEFNLKAMYNNRQSTNQAAPEPIFLGPLNGTGGPADFVSIDATNPFNPFGCSLVSFTPGPGDCNFLLLGRRPLEGGSRIFQQNINTWYISAGLNGTIPFIGRELNWDGNVAFAENRGDQRTSGSYNIARIAQALGPLNACAGASNGCVPLNLFGGQGSGDGSITQEMLDFIRPILKDVSGQDLFTASFNVSGDLFDLPAGPLGFAVGFEYRDQEGFFDPDPVVSSGESNGTPAQPTRGGFDVKEFYGELLIPVLSELPLVDTLELSLAGRISDYDTVGSAEIYKAGIKWRPFKDLLLRGSISEGFRAPGIGELFGTASSFDEELADPCSDMLGVINGGAAQPANVIAACIAQGAPADGSYEQPNPQLRITTGGNNALTPESSDNYVLGAVYIPSFVDDLNWVDRMSFELTWYKVKVKDAIRARAASDQLQGCINSFNPVGGTFDQALCGGIRRNATGIIDQFNNQLVNLAQLKTRGIDLVANYVAPESDWGQISATWTSTWLLGFTESFPTDTGVLTFNREGLALPGASEVAFPKWRWTGTVDWHYDTWFVSVTERFVGGVDELDSVDLNGDPSRLGSTYYTDLQASWTPGFLNEKVTATLGVNNVFNNKPPACFGCGLNGFNATLHDVPGVFGYFRIGVKL